MRQATVRKWQAADGGRILLLDKANCYPGTQVYIQKCSIPSFNGAERWTVHMIDLKTRAVKTLCYSSADFAGVTRKLTYDVARDWAIRISHNRKWLEALGIPFSTPGGPAWIGGNFGTQ